MVAIAGRVLSQDSEGPFDLVNGIPVHPLVVHAAVVFVPLAALGLIAMAIWPRFSARYGWLVAGSGAIALAASVAARQSGEVMPIFAAVLLVAVLALWLIDRRAPEEGPAPRRGLRIGVAVVAVLIAVANLVWVFRVGDSGAKSVWTIKVVTAENDGGSSGED